MTDSAHDSSEDRRTVSQEAFARFLDALSPETEEAGRLYTRLHRKLVGFFSFKGVSDPVSAADETIDRAALKIYAGTPVPNAERYCIGIARFIVKERLRLTQREASSFLKFIENMADSSDEQVERIYRIQKSCFEQLAVEDQNLLMGYCQVLRGRARAEHRRQLAGTMKTTVLAVRMRVTRLRDCLSDCVKKQSQEG